MTDYPARGEEVVAVFRTLDLDGLWKDNWAQDKSAVDVPDTSSSIQGVLCCVDRDDQCSWLLQIMDAGPEVVVSYLAVTFSREPQWPWAWIDPDRYDVWGDSITFDALRKFVNWLEANDEAERRLIEGTEL